MLRGTLAIGFLFGFTVLALDYWLAEPGFSSWSVPVRAGITQVFFLVMLLASFHSSARKSLAQLGTAVGLAVAATFLLLSAFVEGETVRSAFTGYVVVTFYIYLFMGQRFWPALVTAMALFVSFLVATSLRGQAMDMTIYVTYLMFVNLIGATFLYNHENFHRRTFLQTRELNELARRDALTGLANRNSLNEHLSIIWSNAKREAQPVALALIDIDHFKAYNDKYGHQAGDRCLTAIAEVLGSAARRPLDLAARFGGEEFVLLLPGLSAQDAEQITNDLRQKVEALRIRHETSPTRTDVTVSAGLAHLYPHESAHSIQGFVQLADQALYEAKQRGRNRVSVSGVGEDKDTQTGLFQLKPIKTA